MSKTKTSRKAKSPGRKAAGALRVLARKAAKLVKRSRPKAAAPVAKHAAHASRATPAAKGKARKAHGPIVTGPLLSEAQLRRMSESDYMNDQQLEFFRQRLLQMRSEVVEREMDVKERLHQRENFADPADRATAEEEHWLDLRLRERESMLLRKIDDALHRIRDREFGYCEVTGEPIGIPRLLARPTATVSVDVKGQNEQIESQFRDR